MNNSLKPLIFGLAIIFGFHGTAMAEGDGVDMEKTVEEITAICEKEAADMGKPEEYIYTCIDEHVEKQDQNREKMESSPTEQACYFIWAPVIEEPKYVIKDMM